MFLENALALANWRWFSRCQLGLQLLDMSRHQIRLRASFGIVQRQTIFLDPHEPSQDGASNADTAVLSGDS